MLGLTLDAPPDRALRVLAIGAHSDDIEIGAGGTTMRLVSESAALEVRWVVLSADGERADEARASAEQLLAGVDGSSIDVEAFRERYFPHLPELKEWFDRDAAEKPRPDVVIGPGPDDLHQDHRTVAELIRQTFRDQLVLEYEIPKFEGDLGGPNLFVELPASIVDAKLAHLEAAFGSQRSRTWFREEVFRGLLALRGVEGGATSGYAEAFTARKVRIGPRLP
jgi:LmbE family N-acetylglucosaminyl deacetylase